MDKDEIIEEKKSAQEKINNRTRKSRLNTKNNCILRIISMLMKIVILIKPEFNEKKTLVC